MERYRFPADQQALMEGLSQPIAIYQFVDKRVETLVLSDGLCELFGLGDRSQAYRNVSTDMYDAVHPEDIARISNAAYRFATEDSAYEVVYRAKVRGGSDYHMIHAMGKHVYAESGVRLAHVWYMDEGPYTGEVQEQGVQLNHLFNNALYEESLVWANRYDYLTGLPSMTYFFEIAETSRKSIRETGKELAYLYMDLSGMKFFNAKNGFAEGDKLLREFARALKSTFSSDNCCRIGSDHFAVFTEEDGIEGKLRQFFRVCRKINGGNSLSVRVGIYLSRLEDVRVSMACDRAKFACDQIANVYESCFGYYDRNLRDSEERRHYVLSNYDRAIEERWIQVHYQPIIRAVNESVCDEEALSRWFDPDLGLLSPADYIPVLEDAGKIYKLDLYVLEQVLEKMKAQEELGLRVAPHSINLSRSDFFTCDIVEETIKRVDAAGISHSMISIEVTESTIGSDVEFMKEQIGRFREAGFPIWMDDFGSGYSSIDLLQSMDFDLVKFDMSFVRQLDKNDEAKIVLTELMKLVSALGMDAVCEGVETEEQMQFLQEIGCPKVQGFYFSKAIPLSEIVERHESGNQIEYEDPRETVYFEAIGGVSLHDLAIIADEDDFAFSDSFSTLPVGILEFDGEEFGFVRANQPYRDFVKRNLGFDIEKQPHGYTAAPNSIGADFIKLVRKCCDEGGRSFFDETMSNGFSVHTFVRRLGANPVSGKKAALIAVLSVTDTSEGATYASIARALAADYYNIYYVDLETNDFIEYSSQVGRDQIAMERHGKDFFASAERDTMVRIYEEDRERFLASFKKEQIVRELDDQGVFMTTYRLIDSGKPVYANMKISRVYQGASKIIVGISIVDSQMKQYEAFEKMKREHDVLTRIMALSDSYLSMYAIEPETGHYLEYNATSEFEDLGFAKDGDDFFKQGAIDSRQVICPDDLDGFLEWFDKESILKEIDENGATSHQYRLMMGGEEKPVSLRIVKVVEDGREKLIAGIRVWRERRSN